MPPIVSIVGKSGSGKTTLLEALIMTLKQRGYRIAVIKHAAENFELDTVSKDSWRFRQAGSEVTAICSPNKLAIIKNLEHEIDPQEMIQYIGLDCDLILTEGFKQYQHPKIETHLRGQGPELVSPLEQLLAVVTDEMLDINVPQFTRDEVAGIADIIERRVLAERDENAVELFINGSHTPLDKAGENLLLRSLVAIASGLKKIDQLKRLSVFLRRKS